MQPTVSTKASLRYRRPSADVLIALALFAVTLPVYLLSNWAEGPSPYNFHVLLANALIDGRVDLPDEGLAGDLEEWPEF